MATSIDQRTNKLMSERLQKELDQLFEEQESRKAKRLFRRNAKLKAQEGIEVPEDYRTRQGNPLVGEEYLNQKPLSDKVSNADGTGKQPFNFDNWGGWNAMQFASPMYNIAKGLMPADKNEPNYNPYNDKIRSLMANRRFNAEPLLTQNRTAQAVSNRNIHNVARSRGEQMGNYGAAQNYRMAGDASAWATKINADNQYLGEQAHMDYGLGRDISAMDQATQIANKQDLGTKRQFLTQGMMDMTNLSQMQKLMGNQKEMDMYKTGIWKDMYGTNVGRWMENINNLISQLQANQSVR